MLYKIDHQLVDVKNDNYPLKRQEKNTSENVVCWSRLLQIFA